MVSLLNFTEKEILRLLHSTLVCSRFGKKVEGQSRNGSIKGGSLCKGATKHANRLASPCHGNSRVTQNSLPSSSVSRNRYSNLDTVSHHPVDRPSRDRSNSRILAGLSLGRRINSGEWDAFSSADGSWIVSYIDQRRYSVCSLPFFCPTWDPLGHFSPDFEKSRCGNLPRWIFSRGKYEMNGGNARVYSLLTKFVLISKILNRRNCNYTRDDKTRKIILSLFFIVSIILNVASKIFSFFAVAH